ncbi:uncharacterized protein LOC100241616 isoform X2 [Vitis vinifera]|uniref:uncharacterized protein LOC100241616 isoform X2 n=1 Tax=Vitis vinifera TaxID=29760 RepID=UPI00023B221C|nr:uncharacterized protein LOC100241616 isoform X2 [Vitis vinifera]|eukprot:XP_002270440.2 PREDICTED: uncharacterized protein LOC100241616 isoform X2 [Vitis vinifera]
MISREQKRAAMFKKLELLRSITNSHAHSKTSILLDASKYIEELKQKVERLNQEVAVAQNSSDEQIPMPVVRVEAKEKGYLINVLTESSCPGLLVFILEAFEELGLEVLQARVSCSSSFHLEAVGGKENTQGQVEHVDAQVVKQAVLRAIENWNESSEQE